MFCPECEGEFVESVTRCPDCEVDLVEKLEAEPEHREIDLVTVVATGDPVQLAAAEAALDGADIPFLKKGDSLQNLLAGGQLGLGFNPVTGPVEIQVDEKEVERARELLAGLDDLAPLEAAPEDEPS